MRHSLTICSVSFRSWDWLTRNVELTARLNRDAQIKWVIADNGPEGSSPPTFAGGSVRIVPGVAFPTVPYGAVSYHHGTALNETLRHVETRHVLFLDPDFFLVRPSWIADVLDSMVARATAFFGAPWHPQWPYKIRYFPCAHCLFVDTEQVPLATLDFRPDYEAVPEHARRKGTLGPARRAWVAIRKLADPIRFRKRRLISTSRDTGWRIYARQGHDPTLRVECVQPVFRPDVAPGHGVERLLPDRYCLVPKRPGYFSARGFREMGGPDLTAWAWEEFVWRDAPFGFHVRSQPKQKQDRKEPGATRADPRARIDAALDAAVAAAVKRARC